MSDEPLNSSHEHNKSDPCGYEAFKASLRKSAIERISRRQKKKNYFDKFENKVSFATLVFVGIYTVITGGQFFIAKDQEQRQLRAYLTVDAVGITRFNNSDPIEGGIQFKNTGQTPAYKIRSIASIDMSDYPRTINYMSGNQIAERLSAIVGSGGLSIANLKIARKLTPMEYEAVMHGTGAIYIFGRVLYDDAFGKLRCTYFRFFYTGGPSGVRVDGGMAPAEDGNEADKNCDKQS